MGVGWRELTLRAWQCRRRFSNRSLFSVGLAVCVREWGFGVGKKRRTHAVKHLIFCIGHFLVRCGNQLKILNMFFACPANFFVKFLCRVEWCGNKKRRGKEKRRKEKC